MPQMVGASPSRYAVALRLHFKFFSELWISIPPGLCTSGASARAQDGLGVQCLRGDLLQSGCLASSLPPQGHGSHCPKTRASDHLFAAVGFMQPPSWSFLEQRTQVSAPPSLGLWNHGWQGGPQPSAATQVQFSAAALVFLFFRPKVFSFQLSGFGFIFQLLLYFTQHLHVFGKRKGFPYLPRLKICSKHCICFILAQFT